MKDAYSTAALARLYDRIYSFKDYADETRRLLACLPPKRRAGKRLLDVCCGTGSHLVHLQERFEVRGVDHSAAMLRVARRRLPGIRFHRADMVDFDLGRRFDIVICLFSSIGYARTFSRMRRAIAAMARHVAPGGVLAVEPWFTPAEWKTGSIHVATLVDEPELKVVRANSSLRRGMLSYFDLHHLVSTPTGTSHLVEHHELGLFTIAEMKGAFRRAGLSVVRQPEGITGRGLYVGRPA